MSIGQWQAIIARIDALEKRTLEVERQLIESLPHWKRPLGYDAGLDIRSRELLTTYDDPPKRPRGRPRGSTNGL